MKGFIKGIGTAVLACSLLVGMGASVMAAPKTTEQLTTGRTEQNRATGIITPDKVPTLAHYVTDVVLTGKVTIDGPQLVLLVNGQDASASAHKVSGTDKTWEYTYKTSVGSQTGDVTFTIDAYTIYANGKPTQDIHTRAASSVGQTVHVPFVVSYDYTNLNWTSYDRKTNLFSLTYNLVKVWDDGEHEVVQPALSGNVEGTATYTEATSGKTITPPIVFRDFTFSATSPVWTYNSSDNTYSVKFDVEKTFSNGKVETESYTRDHMTPGAANDVTVTIEDVTHSTSLIAPAKPAPVVPSTVSGTVSGVTSKWTGNNANGGNVTEEYTLSYTINGTTYTQVLKTNFTKVGTEFVDQQLTYSANYNGLTVTVTYTLPFVAPASTDVNTTTVNGNKNN